MPSVASRVVAVSRRRARSRSRCAPGSICSRLRGRPSGLVSAKQAVALRVAIDVAVALAWPLTRRVALWVEAAGGFAVLRPNFNVRAAPQDRRLLGAAASFAALVGVELRFGGRTR